MRNLHLTPDTTTATPRPSPKSDVASVRGANNDVRPASGYDQPAAAAAARLARTGGAVGILGMASSLFIMARLVQTWRVTPDAASHDISILGHELSYPAANVAAVLVLGLALLGLAVIVRIVTCAAREITAAARLGRELNSAATTPLHDALVIRCDSPLAFCAGLLSPRVYVSSGAIARLDESALRAVLAHERHHARRRDPLRLATARVLASALVFVPGRAELLRRQAVLSELSADESAMQSGPETRAALARAMLIFTERTDGEGLVGIDPARVDYLVGDAPTWRFPVLLTLGAVAVIALILAVAVLAGQLAAGSASLAPPFLSRRPCVVVLALIPGCLGLIAATVPPGRRSRHWRRAASRPRAGAARGR